MNGSWRSGSGRSVRPGKKLAEGAAGAAFTLVDDPGTVFKLLAKPTQEDERRLQAMLQLQVPTWVPGASAAIAWPSDLVFDQSGRCVGFLMPAAPGPAPVNLSRLALRRERERSVANLGWDALLVVCRNYSAAVAALHAFPIVVCDINLKNVVVAGDLTVTVIDCDSTQVEVGGQLYGSGYFQVEFLAPELRGVADLQGHHRAQSSDLWALAVLIWMTLMDGHHPFAGVWSGAGEPEQDEHAAAGGVPYARGSAPLSPSPEAPPWRAIPRNLQKLFVAAFTSGTASPEKRPEAGMWSEALERARGELKECNGRLGRRHRFPAKERSCPWCEYEDYLGASPSTKRARRKASRRTVTAARQPVRPAAPPSPRRPLPVRPARTATEDLPRAAVRGGRLVLGGAAALLALTLGLAIALTFHVGASVGAEVGAAWHYVWLPLAITAGVAWAGGFAYDVLQSSGGHRFWPDVVKLPYLGIVGSAVGGAFVVGATSEGSAPPSAWLGFPIAVGAAFLVTLLASLVLTRFGKQLFAVPATMLLCLVAVAAAWAAAPRSDLPSLAEQRVLDGQLVRVAAFAHCHRRAVAKLPAGVLRNCLDGMVFCRNGKIRGRLLAFHNDYLLELYGSQQERKVEGSGEDTAEWCNNRVGAYTNTWFEQAHPAHAIGRLLCAGPRSRGVLKWEDPRTDLFGVIRGAGRRGNYAWWRHHLVETGWR